MEFNPIVWNAAKNGDVDALVTALALYPHHIDTPNPHELQKTPLWIAAENGYVEIITKLVEFGSTSIDTLDIDGRTPMFAAAYFGYVSVIETLVRFGSTAIDTPNNDGWTPMHAAACTGHVPVIETLVRLGSQAIDTPDKYGWTPMFAATRCNNVKSFKTLKLLGAKGTLSWKNDKISKLSNTPIDENESAELRYRVYFQRSLAARLLLLE